jgi:hypothetical protein
MYGLLEAAAQIRATGRLRKARGVPALAIRGVRVFVEDPGAEWFRSREYWTALFESLARSRFNRLNLVLGCRCEDAETLGFISQTAAGYGIDFTLGISDNAAVGSGDEMQAALSKLLSSCPSIRAVQTRAEPEAAMYVVRAVVDAGRRITLEAPAGAPAISGAADQAGVPLRIAAAYPGNAPETRHPVYWEIPRRSWNDARGVVAKLIATRAAGFELDLAGAGKPAPAEAALLWGRLAYDPESR